LREGRAGERTAERHYRHDYDESCSHLCLLPGNGRDTMAAPVLIRRPCFKKR
jgi:hypothetical protein